MKHFSCVADIEHGLADDDAILRLPRNHEASARLACYDAIVVQTSEEKARQTEVSSTRTIRLEAQDKSAPEAIESTIPGHFDGWPPARALLSPTARSGGSATAAPASTTSTIRKSGSAAAIFGVFYLEIEGTNRSPRVVRVQ
jgi:hypothetical protein